MRPFLKTIQGLGTKRGFAVEGQLAIYIQQELDFGSSYAGWLAKNLHRLNDSSLKLLETLDKDHHAFVRLSIVATFDYET